MSTDVLMLSLTVGVIPCVGLRVLSPLVDAYRAQRNSSEYWDDYEWLAKQAEKYQRILSS